MTLSNTASYRKALKMELDREYVRRKSRQRMFESRMLSLDKIKNEFEDPSKIAAFTDGGAGAERVVAENDGDGSLAYYRKCVKSAMNRLRKKPKLRYILRLVIKNGVRRGDSIAAILASRRSRTLDAARKLYFAHLEILLNIFCGQCLQGSECC